MIILPYEYHEYIDQNLKVIFHLDKIEKSSPEFTTHWHENIELLYFIQGSAMVQSDAEFTSVKAGEIAIINGNRLHSVRAEGEQCQYYCLIIDKTLCDLLDITPNLHEFVLKTTDSEVEFCYKKIISELENKSLYYRQFVKSYCGIILATLARISPESSSETNKIENKKINMIKGAIQYMYEHFNEDISVNDICRAIGFSKYYFCRTFKEITGQTVLKHLNIIRCNNARALLSDGKHNISESALSSGFCNSSYFSKTYKKLVGNLPSKDLRK